MSLPSADRIFLVGPMGAGKSTIGRQLAELLDLDFLDTDQEIERRTGADIPWIFDVEGEQGFRDREESVIDLLTQRSQLVLATGGGAVMRHANREHLHGRGFVIYLCTTVDQQLERTARDRHRPLLQTSDPEKTLRDLQAIRDPLYREVAHAVVSTEGGLARDVTHRIIKLLRLS
ncbi:MAG: shikimate kinase AroK [Pseudomonadales bacterium]|nr:shikimate kinase AroK [Pseudomonadales bacterium]